MPERVGIRAYVLYENPGIIVGSLDVIKVVAFPQSHECVLGVEFHCGFVVIDDMQIHLFTYNN